MSGGLYVQVEASLAGSPRVLRLSREAGEESATVEGYLVRLWGVWLQHQEGGGLVRLADVRDVEDLVRWCGESGRLASALVSGGWLEEVEPGLWRVDGWSRYERMEQTRESRRAANRERQQRARERRRDDDDVTRDVTAASRVTSRVTDASVTGREVEVEVENSSEETTSLPLVRSPSGSGPAADEPVVLEYPCQGPQPRWSLTEAQVTRWAELYPGLDVLAECRRALAWLEASPGRRKTARGMPRMLAGWLSRAADRGPGPGGGRPQPQQWRSAQDRAMDEVAEMRARARQLREAEARQRVEVTDAA